MDPITLRGCTSRLPQPTEDLTIKGHFVDTARLYVGCKQVLCLTLRDANSPGRRVVWRVWIFIAKYRLSILIVRDIKINRLLEVSVGIELLDPIVAAVSDIDESITVNAHVVR